MSSKEIDDSAGKKIKRREVLRMGMYVAPAILTLSIAPHFAGSASGPQMDDYRPAPPKHVPDRPGGDHGGAGGLG